MSTQDILQRFRIERRAEQATRNGMFGDPADTHEVYVEGILEFTIDGKVVAREEFYPQLVSAMSDVIVELSAPKDPPLLQCVDCKNTESPAGAMARHFNHGRCMHCGGCFKVVRA